MTKMKSKKMTKSTFAVIIMAVLMVAMMAFGGTYAYFTATTTSKFGKATTGRVQLDANSAVVVNEMVVPGQQLLKDGVTVTSNSTVKTYVFVKFTAVFTDSDGDVLTPVADSEELNEEGEFKITPTMSIYHETDNPTGFWRTYVDDNGTAGNTADDITVYYVELEPKAILDEDDNVTGYDTVELEVCDSILFDGWSQSKDTATGSLMDGTLTVTISSTAIQHDAVAGVDAAYAEVKDNL